MSPLVTNSKRASRRISMIEDQIGGSSHGVFESIRQHDADGVDFWFARDLQPLLDYSSWQKFRLVVEKGMEACRQSGHAAADHFNQVVKMVDIGSGAQREVEDFRLTRYACYLIVQNGDPAKPVIALGQTYFAIQTRRQELHDDAALAGLTEDDKRLAVRNELVHHNKNLAAAAHEAGVVTAFDYAIFQDHGYKGLYAGRAAADIHKLKGLKKSQKILDHMGSTELAANLFRTTQADEKLRRERVRGKRRANQVHREVGKKVRQTIAELGGPMPEELPTPARSIRQIERERQRKLAKKG
jgi:DNA-damage-inducible protein D